MRCWLSAPAIETSASPVFDNRLRAVRAGKARYVADGLHDVRLEASL